MAAACLLMRKMPLLVLLLVLTGCPTLGGVPKGPYVHAPSGFVFPESFGKVRRVSVDRFDATGENVGVGYNLEEPGRQVALTLYVRPPLQHEDGRLMALAEQFELERQAVVDHHPSAQSGASEAAPATRNAEPSPGLLAAFRFDEVFAYRNQRVDSLLYLFEYEGWFVKYRITHPAAQAAAAGAEARAFVSTFVWKGGAAQQE